MNLHDIIHGIAPLSTHAMEEARERLDILAKPPGSLGQLEGYAVQLAGITGLHDPASGAPANITQRAVLVFAADNGVCDEGIGSAPQSVTMAQAINMTRGLTGMAVLARANRAKVVVADVGMLMPALRAGRPIPDIRDLRVRASTGNIRLEDAMTRAQAETALLRGALLAQEMAVRGYGLLGIGEMGIGNTTTATAVLSALTGVDPDPLVGAGGGIGGDRLLRKRQVVREALARAQVDPEDTIGVLAALGGLDLCAMTGAFLGAAAARLPVVIDGLISSVAALAAACIAPDAAAYMFASHLSEEPGARYALEQLGLRAPLHLCLRLGEGSGCPLFFALLDAAVAIYGQMATFDEAAIDNRYLDDLTS